MDVLLGAWGLGDWAHARGGPRGNRTPERSRVNLGIPPMSARYPGCVELFPFLLFDHVFVDKRSYQSLLADAVLGFRISSRSKEILQEFHRDGILVTVDYLDILSGEVDRIVEGAEADLDAVDLAESIRESRRLWSQFLTSPGGKFHPRREAELDGTRFELRLLGIPLDKAELRRRSAHDVYDVNTMVVLSTKLSAAVCDWQMYRPFYDQKMVTSFRGPSSGTRANADILHENLDVYLPMPASAELESLYRIREESVLRAFRDYAAFLRRSETEFTPQAFIELRRRLLELGEGPISQISVFSTSAPSASVFSEETVRMIVREEVERRLQEQSHEATPLRQLFQIIGSIHMGDTYKAVQAGTMGPHTGTSNASLQQTWIQLQEQIDLASLPEELSLLRTAMRKRASAPEHDVSTGEIGAAERAAESGDGAKVLEHLRSAGRWAFDCAREIGVSVASEALKKSLGL